MAQMSTIGVTETERLARLVAAERPDIVLVDAPVAGSRGPAEQGKLVVLASGPEQVRDRVAPVFDAVGQRTVWVGPAGAGSRLKLVNNLLLAFVAEGLAAAVAFGDALGLDRPAVLGALHGSPLVSPWAAEKLERIGRDDYTTQYSLALGLKDVNLALREVEAGRFPTAEEPGVGVAVGGRPGVRCRGSDGGHPCPVATGRGGVRQIPVGCGTSLVANASGNSRTPRWRPGRDHRQREIGVTGDQPALRAEPDVP